MSVRKGNFSGADAEHPASGEVNVGNDAVEFLNYEAAEAPDPKVYLTKDGNIESGVFLGELPKGNNFKLSIPGGSDALQYNTVTIHCGEFNVELASAKLS